MLQTLVEKYKKIPVQLKASIWFLFCSILQKGISVIATPIFTRLMSAAEYGQYNVFNSWLTIITVFVSLRMYNAVYTQGLVKFDEERNIFSSSLQGLNFTLVAVWTIFYFSTRNFWNNVFGLTTIQMLLMLSMIWSTSVFNYWAAEQRVILSYKKLVLLTLIISILKPVIGVLLVVSATDKVTARILAIAAVELMGYSMLFFVQLRRGKLFFSAKYWKYALLFCLPLVPHYLSQTVLNSADKIMIEKMIGDSEAGIYSLAYSLSQLMLMVNQALLQTISPWIYQKIKTKQIQDIQRVAVPAMAIIGFANILLISFAPEIVTIFAPEEYYDAIWIIPPVALSGYFTFAYSVFCTFEFYFEKKSYIAIATVISAGANIILNYVFIQMFGYYAAGYTTLLCYIIYTIGHYIIMTRIVKKNIGNIEVYSTKQLFIMTMLFLILGFVFLFTYKHLVLRYIIVGCLVVFIIILRKRIYNILKRILSTRKK